MAGNVVNVGVLVKTTGLKEGVDQSAQFANNMEKVNTAATKASKAIAASGKAAATASNATNAPTGVSTVTDKDYAKVRGAVGTGAAGRDFAKQAQGLGGLVALYATFAANIFAVGAAYEALNKAAAMERLAKATQMMSVQVGVNLKSVSKNLIEASGHALSFQDAMQFTNIGTSAGLAGKQIESLTKIARGAASALGRDVNDSVRRIIQGTAKQEQEILDELGIFVKSKQAFDKYSQQIGVKVADLTGNQRTQAYANEVERLGEKWKEFAEIDDPFSKFAATGKNALNELLTSVNQFIKPVLSFLSESKDAVQALIILISASLAKRALPELGNLFNNLFNYDKAAALVKAKEATDNLKAINDKVIADFTAANIKLKTLKAEQAALVIPTVDKSTIASSIGTAGNVVGKNKEYGLSSIRLTNILKEVDATKTLLSTQQSVQKVIEAQLKNKAKDVVEQQKMLAAFKAKGIIEEKSTLTNISLGKESLRIAEEQYIAHESINKALLRETELRKLVIAQETKVSKLSSEVNTIPVSTARTGKASTIRDTYTVTSNAAIISSNNAVVASVNKVAISEAGLAAVREKGVVAANLLNQAAGIGVLATLKASIAGVVSIMSTAWVNSFGNATKATLVNTAALSGLDIILNKVKLTLVTGILAAMLRFPAISILLDIFAKTGILASGAVKSLGIAISGLAKGLLALSGPLLIVWTLWELFGDKLGAMLPDSVQAALGIGKVAEAAKAAEEKQKAYNESLEVSTKNLAMLADMKGSGKVENLAEEADLEERIAKSLKERVSLITEAATTAKIESEANKRRAEEIKIYGDRFSEAALNAKELSRVLSLANQPELAKQAKDIANEYQYLNSQLKLGNISQEQYAKAVDIVKDKELGLLHTSSISMEQRSSATRKAASSLASMEAALDKVTIANKKLGEVTQGLKSGEAVDFYNNFTNILDKTGNSATGVASMFGILGSSIAAGGKTAALAIPIMAELAAVYRGLIEANVGPQIVQASLATYVDKVLGPQLKALSNSVTIKKDSATKAPKEYSVETKKALRELTNQIDATSDRMSLLDAEFKNTSALDARNQKLRGYTTELEAAAAQTYANEKAELEYIKTIQTAQKEYQSQVLKSSSDPENKAIADARLAREIEIAKQKRNEARSSGEIAKANDDIATKQALITKEYDKQKKDMDASTKAKEDALDLEEMYLDLANASLDLTVEQKAALLEQRAIKRAMYARDDAQNRANLDYAYAINQVMASGATDEIALKEKIDTILADRNAKIEAADTEYNKTVTKAGITTLTTIAEESKKTSDTIRDSLTDAFMDSFENGTNIFENLKKNIESMFNNMVLRPGMEVLVQGGMGSLGIGGTSSSGGGLLSTASNASSIYNLAGGASAFSGAFTAGAQLGAEGFSAGLTMMSEATGLSSFAAGSGQTLGAGLSVAGPYIAAIAAISAIHSATKGESRSGGQYGYSPTGTTVLDPFTGGSMAPAIERTTTVTGAQYLHGPSGGDPYAKEVKTAINATVEGINTIFSNLGTSIAITSFQGGYESSGKGRGGVLAGGTLSTGVTFGESGTGSNYAGNMYETTSTTSPDAATALANFSTDLMQATVQALQAATDIPTTIADMLKGVDAESLSQEEVTTLLTTISNVTAAVNEFNKVVLTLPFENLKKLSFDAAAGLAEAAGGFEVLGTNLATYYNNFYSEEEKRAQTITNINKVVGLSTFDAATATRDSFRDLVELQDVTTESGAKTYAALLSVSGAFSEVLEEGTGLLDAQRNQQIELLNLQGLTYQANQLERADKLKELALVDQSLVIGQQAIYAQEDLNKTESLELQLLSAQGKSTEVLIKTREKELKALNFNDAAVQRRIWQLEDESALLEKKNSQEVAIYNLLGNSAAALQITRAQELATMDEQLKPAQLYIYALQDEAALKGKLKTAYDKEKSAIKATIDSIGSLVKTLTEARNALLLGDKSTLTPAERYAEAKSQAYQVAAIATGIATTDTEIAARNEAVSKLPDVTNTFLEASRDLYASSEQYTQDFNSVLKLLDDTSTLLGNQKTDAEIQLETLSSMDANIEELLGTELTAAEYLRQLNDMLPAVLAAKTAAAASGSVASGGTNINPISNSIPKTYFEKYADVKNALSTSAAAAKGLSEAQLSAVHYAYWGYKEGRDNPNIPIDSKAVAAAYASEGITREMVIAQAKIANVGYFAKGGLASGLSIVGEQGPELIDFKTPTRVYSSAASNQLLSNQELIQEIRNLRKEVETLRNEQKEQTGHLIQSNYDSNAQAAKAIANATEEASTASLWAQRSQLKLA